MTSFEAGTTVSEGTVRDAELCRPVVGAEVELVVDGCTVLSVLTNDSGQWSFPDSVTDGRVVFTKEGFSRKEFSVTEVPSLVRLLEDHIIGYQDSVGFSPGETVEVRVHSIRPYRACLYRHGAKKEKVLDLGEQAASKQSVPDGFFVETGLEWRPSLEYTIPLDSRPGLYSLFLEDGKGRFAVPMAVTSTLNPGREPLLVLASTNTWQSYNAWGGRSRYRNFETEESVAFQNLSATQRLNVYLKNILPRPIFRMLVALKRCFRREASPVAPRWMHNPLSLQRPFTNIELLGNNPDEPFTSHLADAEWRFLAWLEREEIEYDYITGFQLHSEPSILNSYRGLALVGHCEYWSRKMYTALQKAHFSNGLSILNISGNSIYREVDFTPDGSMRCVSLSFMDSCADETEILGVRYHRSDYATCAPYRVVEPEHPLFRETQLRKGSRFGGCSLNQDTPAPDSSYQPGRPGSGDPKKKYGLKGNGASGWETDKLVSHRKAEFTLIAQGENKMGGADMVFRDFNQLRGSVFSASSVTYTGALLVDQTISTITRNALLHALSGRSFGEEIGKERLAADS